MLQELGDLLGEKRISSRDSHDLIEVACRHNPARLAKDDLPDFVWPQRGYLDEVDPVDARRLAQFDRRPTGRPASHRQQQANGFVPQPAQRERERPRRRKVKPLAVVDSDQHRPGLGSAAHQ